LGERDLQKLLPFIRRAQEELRGLEPRRVAERAGVAYTEMGGGGCLEVRLFGRDYALSFPELELRQNISGFDEPAWVHALLLHYFRTADGSPPAGRWVSLRELRDGLFYAVASQGYCGDRLARAFGNQKDRLLSAAASLGGAPLPFGDVGFSFQALPRVFLALVYWQGDEEFPPSAQVLFDANAHCYLPTDLLSVLGSILCTRLMRCAGVTGPRAGVMPKSGFVEPPTEKLDEDGEAS